MPASEPATTANTTKVKWWALVLAGLGYAALTAIAFPPFDLGFIVIASPFPLIWAAMRGMDRPLRTAMWASVGVLPLHLYEHHWVMNVSAFGFWPMAAVMAGFAGLFVWTLARVRRNFPRWPLTFVVPVVWTGVEVFRGEIFGTGYPWLLLAHPAIDVPMFAKPAAVIGTYGVSFVVAMICGTGADRRWGTGLNPAYGLGLCAVVMYTSGPLGPRGAGVQEFKIAVVQTNIPQDNKLDWTAEQREKDFARFVELTRAAAAEKPDLIVWPETMFPGTALDESAVRVQREAIETLGANPRLPMYRDALVALQQEVGIPMVVGAIGFDGYRIEEDGERLRMKFDAVRNSVFIVEGGRVRDERYDKLSLTPFGEVIPLVWRWPWLQEKILGFAAGGMSFDLKPGARPVVLTVHTKSGPVALAAPICFEATKPAVCRRIVRAAGATPCLILNLTNDGWFGGFDAGREQHFQIARWRAVELGVPVVRAANTGVSAAIGANGRVIAAGVAGGGPGWMA